MNSILIVAAHPDDEVLGCGGTIAKLSDDGARVHVAFQTDGVSSRAGEPEQQTIYAAARRAAAERACKIIGVTSMSFGEYPDNRMDEVALLDVAKSIEALIADHRPEMVLTHHGGDLNIDHRRTHEAVMTACRPQGRNPVKTILCFEVPSSTEWGLPASAFVFAPNWFEDVSVTLHRKITALQEYAAELREWPHPRSVRAVEALARWRGATVGGEAAEAFMLGRRLQ